MFNRKRANEILKEVWVEENELPIEMVLAALRKERQGRRTTTVLKAIRRFKQGLEDDAFPAETAPEADATEPEAPKAYSTPKETSRREANRTGAETKQAGLRDELARLEREVSETAERLERLKERFLSMETDDDGLLVRMQDARWRQEEAFWKRVATTVSEIMQSHARLTFYDVLEMLPPDIVQESIRIRVRLDYGTLSRKLAQPMPSEEE